MYRRLLLILILLGALTPQAATRFLRREAPQETAPRTSPATRPENRRPGATTEFARLIEQLSEPGGYFDTDNLISNEASYLHVLGKMRQIGVTGGAYLGVGPDQNFSYIAQIRPRIAFIIDIRRDNLLQHFLFKALFAQARNRVEYLCLLFGKPFPEKSSTWDERPLPEIIAYLDKTPSRRELFEATRAAIESRVRTYGLPLSDEERATIGRIHQAFYSAGTDLRFTSRNRPPRFYYPTYRDLLLEKDLTGRLGNYLAREEDFQFLKSLEEKDLVIPVVGDLAGAHALPAIARHLEARGEKVSAFYTSNVEFYLMREDTFEKFAQNVSRLPRDARSVIIRSYFSGAFGYSHPQSVSGYYSTQLLQTIETLVREHASGGYQSYSDLVSKHQLDLR